MLKLLSVFLLFITIARADILENNIVENSVIRASDINSKLEEIKNAIQSKGGLNIPEFSEIKIGQEVTKSSILSELYKITEIFPLGTELSLSNEITSTELNSLFSSTLNLVNNFGIPQFTYNWTYSPWSNPCSLNSCEGTSNQERTRNITGCELLDGSTVIDSGFHLVMDCHNNIGQPVQSENITCYAPAGDFYQQITEIIPNGYKYTTYTCLQGETLQDAVDANRFPTQSFNCNSGYTLENGQCVESLNITYSWDYGEWNDSCELSGPPACGGEGGQSISFISSQRTAKCFEFHNGILYSENSNTSNCVLTEGLPNFNRTEECLSPAGNYQVGIQFGSMNYSCQEGESWIGSSTFIIECNEGYIEEDGDCIQDSIPASSYSIIDYDANMMEEDAQKFKGTMYNKALASSEDGYTILYNSSVDKTIYRSSNGGIDWIPVYSYPNIINSIKYTNQKFFLLGNSSNGNDTILVSDDLGLTFYNALNGLTQNNNNYQDIIYAKGKYVAISNSGTHRVAISQDLTNWTYHSTFNNSWNTIIFDEVSQYFIASASSGSQQNYTRVMYSSDGENWNSYANNIFSQVWSIAPYKGSIAFAINNILNLAVEPMGTKYVMNNVPAYQWNEIHNFNNVLFLVVLEMGKLPFHVVQPQKIMIHG